MAYSDNINTSLAGLQNENPDYFSQFKGILLDIGLALVALGEISAGARIKQFANGNPIENILKWADLKPELIAVQVAMANAGGDVTELNSLLQPIPTGDGQVYSDQAKPIFTAIAVVLASGGQ